MDVTHKRHHSDGQCETHAVCFVLSCYDISAKKKRSLFILNDNLGKIHVLTCF